MLTWVEYFAYRVWIPMGEVAQEERKRERRRSDVFRLFFYNDSSITLHILYTFLFHSIKSWVRHFSSSYRKIMNESHMYIARWIRRMCKTWKNWDASKGAILAGCWERDASCERESLTRLILLGCMTGNVLIFTGYALNSIWWVGRWDESLALHWMYEFLSASLSFSIHYTLYNSNSRFISLWKCKCSPYVDFSRLINIVVSLPVSIRRKWRKQKMEENSFIHSQHVCDRREEKPSREFRAGEQIEHSFLWRATDS